MGHVENEVIGQQRTEDSLTVNAYRQQFAKPEFEIKMTDSVSELTRHEIQLRREAYKREKLQKSNSAIKLILESAKKKDTLGDDMKEVSTKSARSTWLTSRTIPEQSVINSKIQDATDAFRIASLSDSQKTKRGKKFKKRAEDQAKMINLMNQCHWQREESLDDLLQHGRNARYGTDIMIPSGDSEGETLTTYRDREKDTFLENVGDDVDQVSLMLRDLSFYLEQKRTDKTKESDKGHPVNSLHYKQLEMIAESDTRSEAYKQLLGELEDLDLSIFDYKDNEEFMNDKGENSFVRRYATLKAFGHAMEMIRVVGRGELGDERYMSLSAKAFVVREILEDYNNRAILLQSPYHVLLSGRDFDKLSKEDLKERIKNTDDILAKKYMERVLERREKDLYGKGSKANSVLKDAKKNNKWRTVLDTKNRADMVSHFNKYMLENNDDLKVIKEDSNSKKSLKTGWTRLKSLLFRKKNNLPVKDEEEQKFETEYEEAKGKQTEELTIEKWVEIKKEEIEKQDRKVTEKADSSFLSLSDTSGFMKKELLLESTTLLDVQKNDESFRKDFSGEVRMGHLKKYEKKAGFKEEMVQEDVKYMVNNLVADYLLTEKVVDLDILEKRFQDYVKIYTLMNRYREYGEMTPNLDQKRVRTDIANIKELLEKNPENREELERQLKELNEEEKKFGIRRELAEAFMLKFKNKFEVIKKYYIAKEKLRAIKQAKLLLDKEGKGLYRDAMMDKLEKMEKEEQEKVDYGISSYDNVMNSTVGVPDPFTDAQLSIMSSFGEIVDRVNELKKKGEDGKEESLALLDEARNTIGNYEDPVFQARLKIGV